MFLLQKSHLEVKIIPGTKMATNRGVFAAKDIPGGVVIGDYLGKIIAQDDEDESKYGTYYMTYSSNSSIYGDPSAHGVHIINNSCMPNCGMVEYETHILYYALRKIFKGEELTVKYELGIPDKNCNPCTHQCHCGTPLCTGTTHSSEDDAPSYVYDIDEKEFLKPGAVLPPLKKYPKIIRDSAVDNIYGSIHHSFEKIDDEIFPQLISIRKRIRDTGRSLYAPKLGLIFYGVHHNYLLSKYRKA